MSEGKKPSKTKIMAAKVIHAAMCVLRDNGKEMRARDVKSLVEQTVELSDWERERSGKTGYIRWQTALSFYSVDCVKAGYIVKKKGVWYLTPEGEDALKLSPEKLLDSAAEAYWKWKSEQPKKTSSESDGDDPAPVDNSTIVLEDVEQRALEGLEAHIKEKNAYEFQDLVAALMRGMGYYTPFVAPKGKDGGVDVVAYRDPLGTGAPRIKVQVKHQGTSTPVGEVRQLIGLLQKDGDVGIFVSTGGFTPDSKTTARGSHIHIELIDLPRFITLWQDFYDNLSDEDKTLLPLTPVYFLAHTE